ncbi:zinc-binding dehydrogenase [Dactylosporangium sp. NPDC050688]|uniref:zinc-binding dehydrogenase n=1 Tax=Dactylosporangium sp. NPDC050688 TaxID=3157217 RepID=UPI00340CBD65
MQAVMFHAYGPPEVLVQAELPVPVPRRDQVLVRVHATTVTSAECGMRRGEPRWGRLILGPRRPRKGVRVLGLEFAGEVAALRDLLAGQRLRVVIDRTYPLSEIVEAHRYVDSGHKVGNVVITVPGD